MAAAFCALCLLSATDAMAQTAQQNSVRGRSQPDFTPLGLELDRLLSPLGLVSEQELADKSSALSSFVIRPKLDVTIDHQTNLFRTASNTKGDNIVLISPGFAIASDWTRHSVEFAASADIGRHGTNGQEDFEDLKFLFKSSANVTESFTATGSVTFSRSHLQRGAPDDPNITGGAVVFHNTVVDLRTNYQADKLRLNLSLVADGSEFESSGETSNRNRDRVITTVTMRVGCEFSPGTAVFVEPSFTVRASPPTRRPIN